MRTKKPSVSLICSVGDYPSRSHHAHQLSNFQLISLSSTSCATFEPYLCMPSISFLRLRSELSFANLILRGFTVLLLQIVVRLSQVSFYLSHATILLSADISTTTDNSFEACIYAPRCVNQRDYLSPSGDNLAAIIFKCSCLSTFVGHSFHFGIHFVFGRYLFRLIFNLLVSLAMISPCDSSFQHFDDFAYAERSFQSLLKIFKYLHGDFKLCMWISIIIYWQSLIPDETLKFSKMTGKILGFITWENSQRRMFSSKVSFDNAQAEAVLLLLCALLPHIMRGWKLLCFYLAPSCKHASVVWCSKIEGPPIIGELMCGSVARKAFHKAE